MRMGGDGWRRLPTIRHLGMEQRRCVTGLVVAGLGLLHVFLAAAELGRGGRARLAAADHLLQELLEAVQRVLGGERLATRLGRGARELTLPRLAILLLRAAHPAIAVTRRPRCDRAVRSTARFRLS